MTYILCYPNEFRRLYVWIQKGGTDATRGTDATFETFFSYIYTLIRDISLQYATLNHDSRHQFKHAFGNFKFLNS